MTPEAAAQRIETVVHGRVRKVQNGMNVRLPRAANALRNVELKVLSGNKSPSPPGSPPGRRTGVLRTTWTLLENPGTSAASFGIRSGVGYSSYLEHGTRKMAARPYVDKIQQRAWPEIVKIFSEMKGYQ